MFKDPVAVGLDASRFDQHVSVDALLWEFGIYDACFPVRRHKRRLRWLLGQQLNNECVGYVPNGRVKYTTVGGRMSGDMNTSLGNCILMCSMVHAYARHARVKIQLANNGDDCVVFMGRSSLARFMAGLDDWFTRMGFKMAVEPPCHTFEEIEFCQTHPVWVGPGASDYVMVRHPKWAIAKDTVCARGFTEPHLLSGWINAVGTGGLAMTGGIPVFQDFYRFFVENSKAHKSVTDGQSWGVRMLRKGMERYYMPVSDRTRASFYWAFGVTPDEQLVLEDFYRRGALEYGFGTQVHYQTAMPL